jgi:hypothetical protein
MTHPSGSIQRGFPNRVSTAASILIARATHSSASFTTVTTPDFDGTRLTKH